MSMIINSFIDAEHSIVSLPTPVMSLLHSSTGAGSGTTWNDASGNGRNATLVNSPSWVTTSFGAGVQVGENTNQYINIDNLPHSATVGNFSFACRLYLPNTNPSPTGYLLADWNFSQRNFLYTISGGNLRVIAGDGGFGQGPDFYTPIAQATWLHLAIVREDITSLGLPSGYTGRIKVYIDGELVNQDDGTYKGGTTTNLRVLCNADSFNASCPCTITDAYFYDQVLTDDQVYTLSVS